MRHGTSIILATGVVSGESPDFFFKFGARAHQTLKIETRGGGLKHAGIAITLPSGKSDGVEEGAPYKLPETGNYLFSVHANTMSDGPFGKFTLRLQIR